MLRDLDLDTTATCLRCGATFLASLVSCPLCDAGLGEGGDDDYTRDLPLVSGATTDDWQSGVAEAVSGRKKKDKRVRLFVRMPKKEGGK